MYLKEDNIGNISNTLLYIELKKKKNQTHKFASTEEVKKRRPFL